MSFSSTEGATFKASGEVRGEWAHSGAVEAQFLIEGGASFSLRSLSTGFITLVFKKLPRK